MGTAHEWRVGMMPSGEMNGDGSESGGPTALRGIVASINVSGDGLPKHPIARAAVSVGGMAGDRQRDLVHHGGRERAVCLYSSELIDALRAEGHPVAAGNAGETLTVCGVPWNVMSVGTRIEIGDLGMQITGFANPCHNLRPYFADGTLTRISQKVHPGWSRVYARVVRPGTVALGDVVSVFRA